jgi:hypothetical protein
MTRHYTHVGELAASRAVAALPAVIGDVAALPERNDPEGILSDARAIAEKITAKNWREQKSALLALLAGKGISPDSETRP